MCGNCGQSFLPNRSHKSGAGIYHFTSSYSKSKEQTLATVVSHKLQRHENDQLKLYSKNAIIPLIAKIKPTPTIEQKVYFSTVTQDWKNSS